MSLLLDTQSQDGVANALMLQRQVVNLLSF